MNNRARLRIEPNGSQHHRTGGQGFLSLQLLLQGHTTRILFAAMLARTHMGVATQTRGFLVAPNVSLAKQIAPDRFGCFCNLRAPFVTEVPSYLGSTLRPAIVGKLPFLVGQRRTTSGSRQIFHLTHGPRDVLYNGCQYRSPSILYMWGLCNGPWHFVNSHISFGSLALIPYLDGLWGERAVK